MTSAHGGERKFYNPMWTPQTIPSDALLYWIDVVQTEYERTRALEKTELNLGILANRKAWLEQYKDEAQRRKLCG